MLNGILVVDKPRGMTSHDVVASVRRMAGVQAVGHTGTLDPDASGVLLLCLGRATKFARFFEGLEKTYWTVLRLGTRTDTQDATGTVISRCPIPELSPEDLQGTLRQFTGALLQIPPMYSAVKYQGQRLYRLARQGQTVSRAARRIVVRRLELVDMRGAWVTLLVTCSKGTYIRTLCEDIGLALGCGAHMRHLQRCQVGSFLLKSAYTLDVLQQRATAGGLHETLIPLADALEFLPPLSFTTQQYYELQRGQGRGLPAVLKTIPGVLLQAPCYRLWTQPQGTFAVLHRRSSTPAGWRLRYLETSHAATASLD